MQGVSKRREASGRTRFLAEADPHGGASELARLLAACRDSASADLYPAVVLALCTGARRGEVLGLGWADLDLDHATATFRKTKNRSVRTLELPEEAVAVLRARGRRLDTALLFPSPKDAARPVDLRSAWHTALARAGITDFRWHDLRHTAASYLAMSGLPLHEIAAVLGHKSLQMTQRYAHLAPAHVARAAATLGARVMRGVGEREGMKDDDIRGR
jgi:integrase